MLEKCARLCDTSQWCAKCGLQLEADTDWFGNVVVGCPRGCVGPHQVGRRRVPCPACGGVGWAQMGGCRACGYGVKSDRRLLTIEEGRKT